MANRITVAAFGDPPLELSGAALAALKHARYSLSTSDLRIKCFKLPSTMAHRGHGLDT